jgi:hypothetical protein
MPSYLRPIPTRDGQGIKEWQYQRGAWYLTYSKDQLLTGIFRRSQTNYDLGEPCLGAQLIDIEADLQASNYNNIVFQKGGLLGMAVLLESGASTRRGAGPTAYAQYLQAQLSANNSGMRAGYETVVFENTKDVKILNDLGNMDLAFGKSSDKCAKQIAHVWGVPHEMIGIVTNASQQYHAAAMMDYGVAQLDKTILEVLRYTNKFINEKILPAFGIRNVRVESVPRRNSVTRTATQAGTDLGQLNVVSKNEYRSGWLGLPEWDGPQGDEALMVNELDGGTKPGANGGGGKPSALITPPKLPSVRVEVEADQTNDQGFN